MVEFVSANPTGPMHVGHGRGAAYGATLGNLLEATGHSRLSRVLHQRRRPADRHPRGQRLSTLSRAVRRDRRVSVERLLAPNTSCRWRKRCMRQARRRAAASAPPTSRAARRPMRPGRRQGQTHRRADREFAPAARRGRVRFHRAVRARPMMADIRNDLEEFGVRFDRWYSERELNQSGADRHARSTELRESGRVYTKDGARVVQVHRIRRRRRPRGRARERREDLLRLRHRLPLRQARSAATSC